MANDSTDNNDKSNNGQPKREKPVIRFSPKLTLSAGSKNASSGASASASASASTGANDNSAKVSAASSSSSSSSHPTKLSIRLPPSSSATNKATTTTSPKTPNSTKRSPIRLVQKNTAHATKHNEPGAGAAGVGPTKITIAGGSHAAVTSGRNMNIKPSASTLSMKQKQKNMSSGPQPPLSTPKIPYFSETIPIDYNTKTFSTVNQVQIHHQSSSLHYCYNPNYHENGKGGAWSYQGSTTLYLTLDTSTGDGSSEKTKRNNPSGASAGAGGNSASGKTQTSIQMREIALHLRHGESITIMNARAYTPLPTTTTTIATEKKGQNISSSKSTSIPTTTTTFRLLQLPRCIFTYFDPLHKIYTKRSNTFSATEYMPDHAGNKRTKRYECDGYSFLEGGGSLVMEEMRCCSIASNFGEMRIQVTCPVMGMSIGGDKTKSKNIDMSKGDNSEKDNDIENRLLKELWKDDLLNCTSGDIIGLDDNDNYDDKDRKDEKNKSGSNINIKRNEKRDEYVQSNGGELELELKRKSVQRSINRRNERIDLIASRLANNDLSIFSTESPLSSSSNNKNNGNDNNDNTKLKGNNSNSNKTGKALGIKLIIDFQIDPVSSGSNHFGGIHFHSPPTPSQLSSSPSMAITTTNQTPHVYTTSGITGDNFGPRCYIPTIDSSSIKHRFSHELTMKVTSNMNEGLWAAGCGENYGVNGAVVHSIPRLSPSPTGMNMNNTQEQQLGQVNNHNIINPEQEERRLKEESMMKVILGKKSVDFIARSFASTITSSSPSNQPSSSSMPGKINSPIHVIPSDEHMAIDPSMQLNNQLATSVWTTSIWSPCPARSIGFAIGPFKVLYDPEYYGKQEEEDDDDDEDMKKNDSNDGQTTKVNADEDEDDEDDYPTISETALIKGEGIRQLYFAPSDERCYIHSESSVITDAGLINASTARMLGYCVGPISTKPSSASTRLQKKQYILSVMGATSGVPNRALSLMRDILALPSYRTISYTQIWIPHAVDGGSSCGALHSCPEVSCNPFLGCAIMDATMLPPLGQRLPFHFGGRALQLLQARNAVRGWIRAALPLGGTDEIGYSYIHTLFEEFIMSLYEKSHGAFGEGGSKQSFFFTKRFAIGSGLNSRNLDFLPVHNVEEEDFDIALGGVVGALPAG